jgi:hypothetical protein
MNSQPRSAARVWWPALLAVAAANALCWSAAAQAQEKQFALKFSSKAGDPSPRASLPLRPNLTQNFFVYVDNLNGQNAKLKVEVRADGKVIDGGSADVTMEAGQKITPIVFGKPAEKPPATPAPPAPPAFAEVKGALKIVLLDMANKPIDEVTLNVAQPKDYVQVTKISFNPSPVGERKNQLRVELKANPATFAGPPCRVDLVLDPSRIPGLAVSKKLGTQGGFLAEPGAELVLTADNLAFTDAKEENGFVYLTIDGWQRALSFSTTFPREGTESTPEQVNTPVVRLLAPKQANPGQPVKVTVEADNLGQQVVELGLDADNDGKFSKLNGEIVDFTGNRMVKLLVNPAFPGGALQLKPEVRDWSHEFELAEVFGKRTMRVRLLKNADEAKKPKDEDREVDPNLNKAFGLKTPVTEIRHTVVLDGSPPEGVKFVNFPKSLVKGDVLPVSAVGVDPESGIEKVVFFVGKLGPDGKVPPNTQLTPGKLTDAEKDIWSAVLDAPTDQKGKFDVTVQFVNFAGLVTTDTVKIELIDPGKEGVPGAGGAASIQGKLIDGTGRPQGPGILVELRDDKGAVKDTTKTDAKSDYLFDKVAPGTYTVVGLRTANNTKGATTVGVKPGEKKVDVDVKLSR